MNDTYPAVALGDAPSTREMDDFMLFQKLFDFGQVRKTPEAGQTTDFYFDWDQLCIRVQAKGRKDFERLGEDPHNLYFSTNRDYDETNLDLYFLAIYEHGRVAVIFLVPRQVLWRHGFFKGQTARYDAFGQPVLNPTMRHISVPCISGILEIPGLAPWASSGKQAYLPEATKAFARDLKACMFRVQYDQCGLVKPLSKTDLDRARRLIKNSGLELNRADVRDLPAPNGSKTDMFEAGISKRNVIYVMGFESYETVTHANCSCRPIKLDYDGTDFSIPEWTVEIVADDSVPGWSYRFVLPAEMFFRRESKTTYGDLTEGKGESYYTKSLQVAQHLHAAFCAGDYEKSLEKIALDGGADRALAELATVKGLELAARISQHKDFVGDLRLEAPAPKKRKPPSEPTRKSTRPKTAPTVLLPSVRRQK